MTNIIRNAVLILLGIVVGVGVYFAFNQPRLGEASPASFLRGCRSATATSTLSYMSWGAGTTTVSCGLGGDGAREAVVSFQLTASSTGTDIRFAVEESLDGQDWYPVLGTGQELGTTSPEVNLALKGTYAYKFSSSSQLQGGPVYDAQATSSGMFSIPVRMQFVRVYAYLASTSGHLTNKNGAVWFQILPRQEY